jgi:hypothetical protein
LRLSTLENGHPIGNPLRLVALERFTKPDPNARVSLWFNRAEKSAPTVAEKRQRAGDRQKWLFDQRVRGRNSGGGGVDLSA